MQIYQQTIPNTEQIPKPAPVDTTQPVLRYRILNATQAEEELPVSISKEELNENLQQLTVSAWINPNYTSGSADL